MVEDARSKVSAHVQRTAEDIHAEASRLGFGDIRQLFNAKGQLLPVHEWPDEIAAAVSGFDVVTRRRPGGEAQDVEYVAKVRCHPKVNALELLAKLMGLLKTHVVREDPMKVIDIDALTDAEVVEWDRLLQKAMAARAPRP